MSFTAPQGFRVAIALRQPVSVPPGFRVPVAFGDADAPPPPPPPPVATVVGALTASRSLAWGGAQRRQTAMRTQWGGLASALAAQRVVWGGAASCARPVRAGWSLAPSAAAGVAVRWQAPGDPVRAAGALAWAVAPVAAATARAAWRSSRPDARGGVWARWVVPPVLGAVAAARWRGQPFALQRPAALVWNAPPVQHRAFRLPWGVGRGLEWVVRPPVVPPVVPAPLPVDGSRVALRFMCREYSHKAFQIPLRFGVPACYAARPSKRAYIVLNQIEVVRLPDRLPIHVDAVSIAGGRDGWCWAAQLTLADPTQLALVQPTATGPCQIEIRLNGYAWVIAVESFDKGEAFVGTEVSLAGRSVTAQLAEPYAAPRSRELAEARTMAQLAGDEVDGSAITAQYATTDWLVPAGAWYFDGLTPMAALVRIAEAAGAVVQSHPADPVVQIRPRFPVSPWHWPVTAPDVVIPDDIITGTRLQVQTRPAYDAVIVAGELVGVSARVVRDGEAGQTYAPQQVDQLITHADGARERGRNVLSERGQQAAVDHDLPLFAAPLQPGQPGLVLPLMQARRVAAAGTWHGLVVAVRIEARRQDAAIDIVQTVTIERHYTDAD